MGSRAFADLYSAADRTGQRPHRRLPGGGGAGSPSPWLRAWSQHPHSCDVHLQTAAQRNSAGTRRLHASRRSTGALRSDAPLRSEARSPQAGSSPSNRDWRKYVLKAAL